MHQMRDFVERSLVFMLLLLALSGLAFGVATMVG
jgi:hypothetical protein